MTCEDTMALSADDVKAMRQCSTASFHHMPDCGGTIVCKRRVRSTGPFDERERSHEFKVSSSFSGRFHDGEDGRVGPENAYCFAMEHGGQYSEEWQTIAHFVRAGDELTLHWCADYLKNGYLDGARVAQTSKVAPGELLHGDLLMLKVKRGDKRFAFHLHTSICPHNTARMIRDRRN